MQAGCKITLHLACRKLLDKDTFSKSDPQIWVFGKQFRNNCLDQNWSLLGKTEIMKNNLNPTFQTSIILDYIFEIKQPLRFEVRDVDGEKYDDLGFVESTVGTIFGSRNQTCILNLSLGGKLITMCEKNQDLNELYIMQIKGSNLKGSWCSSPNPSFKIFKCSNNNEFFAYESEHVHKTSNPLWKTFQMKQFKIGDKFKIEVYDSIHKTIGSNYLTIDQLKKQQKDYQLSNNGGLLQFTQFETIFKFTFMDYIQGGTQLNLSIAIDFTQSNGDQDQYNSLHKIYSQNQYSQALTSIGEILLAYDYDQQVPCYGFGAKLNFPYLKSNTVSHCFPLSGDPNNTYAQGLDGILQMYQSALNHLLFSGPTYFGPLIVEAMKQATIIKQQQLNQYLVLLILTDGAIHDMDQVEQYLEQAAFLPISIIIIGVGEDDFTLMKRLDGDLPDGAMKQQINKRDLVQFVPFRDFKNSMLLAKEVLEELPDQLTNYMEMQGIKPGAPPVHQMQDFGMTMPQQQQQIQ
ncbi:unnamed protein product [Paramecium pentaurelia]|uniref:Uncharacterized protein n=1 Tax=Paramecium pentaurelia TaxID=43138 RepID=A0A8S1TQ03_9CILI|nr:unnamed protein product [Paramecium pentaurelia]